MNIWEKYIRLYVSTQGADWERSDQKMKTHRRKEKKRDYASSGVGKITLTLFESDLLEVQLQSCLPFPSPWEVRNFQQSTQLVWIYYRVCLDIGT